VFDKPIQGWVIAVQELPSLADAYMEVRKAMDGLPDPLDDSLWITDPGLAS